LSVCLTVCCCCCCFRFVLFIFGSFSAFLVVSLNRCPVSRNVKINTTSVYRKKNKSPRIRGFHRLVTLTKKFYRKTKTSPVLAESRVGKFFCPRFPSPWSIHGLRKVMLVISTRVDRVFTTQKQKTNTRLDFRFRLSNAIKPLNRERETHAWLSQSRAILGKRRPWPSCVLDFWDRKYVTATLVVFKELDYVCHKWWSYSNNIYMWYFAAVSCYHLVVRPAYWIT